ncbi:Uncharacterised protein [Acinetobacter baumannii]|uniref:hypothetical protein n=1 Tax=Gammaproteobacteria TaxID=1236 RepID=UPI000DE60BA4|nr:MULTISPECIES: hypothetical protein [Gammaproteobacteria]SSI90040.1 Uncharacterised protein [Acinetobacter baumannii]SSO30466.1 Uncharacterised protein [Acinetobacter baumannii]SSP09048.1 Uncharacterised protein [Acinetobacter baumannii]
MAKLTEADTAFLNDVIHRAFEVSDSNNNEDFRLTITKQDIKENTGRKVVRDVVLESYRDAISEAYNTTSRVVGDKIISNIPSNSPFSEYDLNRLKEESDRIRKEEEEEG